MPDHLQHHSPDSVLTDVTAYINAGGRGTRLLGLYEPHPEYGIAKALVEVGDPPVKLIDHHIARLTLAGVPSIVVGSGHQNSVAAYVDARYGIDGPVKAARADRQLGSGGELLAAINTMPGRFKDHILIGNVDTVVDVDLPSLVRFHKAAGAVISIALTSNTGVPNEGAYYLDKKRQVVYCAEAAEGEVLTPEQANRVTDRGSSTGVVVANTDFLYEYPWNLPETGEFSLYRHVIGAALGSATVAGYDNGTKFFMDVGTVATLTQARETGALQPYLHYPH